MTDIQEENGEALSENEVAAEAPTEPAPKKVPIPQIVKPHSKFAQYNVQTRF